MAELKSVYIDRNGDWVRSGNDTGDFYLKSEADEYVSKLKEPISKENKRLNRALYKALANWALYTMAWLDCIDQGNCAKWSEMRKKCLAKVEVYK